ncbi:MAG: hypothetical protein Kow0069_16670 [Promethearchaeota archaeon]
MSAKEQKEKFINWLVQYGIPRERINEPSEGEIDAANENLRDFLRRLIRVPYPLKTEKGETGVTLEADLVVGEKWLQVKVLLMRNEHVPPKVRADLHRMLLEANFSLNEVTYSLDADLDVFVETDMPVDTDFDNFAVEYGSVEFGVNYFLGTIIPALRDLEVRNTYRGPNFYT